MTAPVSLAFSGRLGSGKSTLAHEVAARLGWPVASFGGYLRQVAAARGMSDTRETLQELGAALLADEGPSRFTVLVLRSAGWQPGEPVVIEGVRHISVVSVLKELTVPLPLLLVYLQTPDEVRLQRLKKRGERNLKELHATESHSTEVDVSEKLRDAADLLVDSDQELSVLVRLIVDGLPR